MIWWTRGYFSYTCIRSAMNMKNIVWMLCVAFIFTGCDKSEGEGGNSSISGKVSLQQWNSTFTVMNYEAVAADYDVYIVYGDDLSYSDKTSTDYQGDFEFKYLRKGDYTIYVYSKVNTAGAINGDEPSEEALVQSVTLDKKEDLVLELFVVLNN